jgi:hypothetical protein
VWPQSTTVASEVAQAFVDLGGGGKARSAGLDGIQQAFVVSARRTVA